MPRFAANLTMLFQEHDFLDRFGEAAQAGFRGVEFLFPYAFRTEAIAERLVRHGLSLVLHNLPAGDWEAGERGIAVLPERGAEFRDGVARAIDYAGALGCDQVNCLAGIAPPGAERARLHATFRENLAFAATELAKAGIRLLIEPVNTRDIPGFFLTNTAQALALIEEVNSENLFLQYDAYHMQVMEGDLARTIAANLARIAHIQLADNPGRHEPGTGEINYPFLFGHLDAIGYGGWIGCEYRPASATRDDLSWFAPYRA
ncbi:hydroxypyruvate isomerase [Methylobacterium sp. J-068]|uniref:hydroxypyruvate isomerase n=1 Tax=Methylobacterium sp. J-068 TaxID=2836649 RepID=UPI001FBBCCDB|nr:hydroxypyruvate isomerase [Methylobacterium sp. J-068]MCJ2034517.1 hydroxypyruvate isomerase [Methylobacterium sp. J-068]